MRRGEGARLPGRVHQAETARREPRVLQTPVAAHPFVRAEPAAAGEQVLLDHVADGAIVAHQPPAVEEEGPLAELLHGVHVVADEEDRAPAAAHLAHLPQAPLLELRVADREHLVHHQDLGLQVGGHGEGQAHVHAARVVLHRRVEEALHAGEVDDLVEAGARSRRAASPAGRR